MQIFGLLLLKKNYFNFKVLAKIWKLGDFQLKPYGLTGVKSVLKTKVFDKKFTQLQILGKIFVKSGEIFKT